MQAISCKEIIQQTVSNFGLTIKSEADCIEWIGDCIEAIGYHTGFDNKWYEYTVINNTIEQPCDLFDLNYILYNCKILHKGVIENEYRNLGESPNNIILNDLINTKCKIIEELECCENETKTSLVESYKNVNHKILSYLGMINHCHSKTNYFIDGHSCWKTNIEDNNKVIIYYKAFKLDEEGFPMIVNEYNYKQAVKYYILRSLMEQGFVHQMLKYNDVYQITNNYIHKASNYGAKFNRIGAVNFLKAWTRVINNSVLLNDIYP